MKRIILALALALPLGACGPSRESLTAQCQFEAEKKFAGTPSEGGVDYYQFVWVCMQAHGYVRRDDCKDSTVPACYRKSGFSLSNFLGGH